MSSALRGFYAYSDTLQGVFYGAGSLATGLPKLLDTLEAKKAFIVTGKTLHTKTDVIRRVESVLKDRQAYGDTFFDIKEHAPIADIRRGITALKNAQADVVISVGGGSPIDAAKAIIYNLQKESGGEYLKHVAIPTTLSAAEYTVNAGYTNEAGDKVGVVSTFLGPAGIILDSELTLATPERLWLSTGLRALDHAVENLYRPLVPEPLKMMCYSAIADLFKYLPKSKTDPGNLEYRQKLQVASWMSIWPLKLEKVGALGLSHSLGHRLGARYGISHGITSCLTLAPTVALKADIASEDDKQHLVDALFYLRVPSTGTIRGDVLKLSELIDGLVIDLGLKSNLTDLKVPKGDVPKIAELALNSSTDPSYERVVRLLEGLY